MKYTLLSLLFIFSWNASAVDKTAQPVKLKWVLEHQPVKYFKIAADKFKEVAEADSKGQIQVIIEERSNKEFPNFALRQLRRDAPARLIKGEINVAQIYTANLTEKAPALTVMSVPYLFESHDHVTQVIEGPIGEELLNKASTDGLRTLAFTYSGGFENILTHPSKPLNAVSDITKISNKSFSPVIVKLLGMTNAEYKGFGEDDILNFKKDKISALSLTYTDISSIMHSNAPGNYYPTEHNVLFTAITMSEKLHSSLSEELKKVVKKASIEAARAERLAIIADGEDGLKKLTALPNIKNMGTNAPFVKELRAKLDHAEKNMSPEVQSYAKRIRELAPKSGKKMVMNQ